MLFNSPDVRKLLRVEDTVSSFDYNLEKSFFQTFRSHWEELNKYPEIIQGLEKIAQSGGHTVEKLYKNILLVSIAGCGKDAHPWIMKIATDPIALRAYAFLKSFRRYAHRTKEYAEIQWIILSVCNHDRWVRTNWAKYLEPIKQSKWIQKLNTLRAAAEKAVDESFHRFKQEWDRITQYHRGQSYDPSRIPDFHVHSSEGFMVWIHNHKSLITGWINEVKENGILSLKRDIQFFLGSMYWYVGDYDFIWQANKLYPGENFRAMFPGDEKFWLTEFGEIRY